MMKSIQLTILEGLWAENQKEIKNIMVHQAQYYLKLNLPIELWCGEYEHLFGDGAFDPFRTSRHPLSKVYECAIEHLGNEDDECSFISTCWIHTLRKRGKRKYAEIVKEFERIEREGY
jgi:hypothetical protein